MLCKLLQKLKTRVVKNSCNPEWNEELTLSISQPDIPLVLTVYDHDTFTVDDKMGSATIDIKQFLDSVTLHLENLPNGTIISKVPPTVENCLAEESSIVWNDGKIVQDMSLRLRNVESGAVEVQLEWIDLPVSSNF